MRQRRHVLGHQVPPEVAAEVAPHGVNVIAVVLRVVVFDEERRTLDLILGYPPVLLDRPRPR